MFKKYIFKLIFRVSIFSFVLYMYLFNNELLRNVLSSHVNGITPLHVVWLILMIEMIIQISPHSKISMGCLKQFRNKYTSPKNEYEDLELYKNIQKMNITAIKVLLSWLFFNAIIGILYLMEILDVQELLLISVFYYVCDLICVIIWCPFQSLIMKNRCCVNCRIFNWGHFMMYTPMLFIRSFFSWSLFFMSILILIRWEIVYLKYPERFWEGSNESLKCINCNDKLCKIKKPVMSNLIKETDCIKTYDRT